MRIDVERGAGRLLRVRAQRQHTGTHRAAAVSRRDRTLPRSRPVGVIVLVAIEPFLSFLPG
jgi:hypothetical protein